MGGSATLHALRVLQEEMQAVSTEPRFAKGQWLKGYKAATAYPAPETLTERRKRWVELAKHNEETYVRYRCIQHSSREDAAVVVPAGALQLPVKLGVCRLHRKPPCAACKANKAGVADCCMAHHRDDDGLAVYYEFCDTHRMTRCGDCLHSTAGRGMRYCCRNHHVSKDQRSIRSFFKPKTSDKGHGREGPGTAM